MTARKRLPDRAAFAVVSVALVLVFLASGSPIPLYNTFRIENGVSNAGLAITTVVYLTTTALALLTTGRLSNHLGRRPVAIGAVLLAIAGCVVIASVHDLATLMTGRVLQGLACGIASSALGAYVIDTAPPRPRWLAAAITSGAPGFAIPVGALLSGALVQYAPAPRFLVFMVVGSALTIVAALLLACPETVRRAPGVLRSLRPRVLIPRGDGRILFAAGAGFVATWSLGGFYQAFSPALTADQLGTSNALVIAVVFSSIVVLSPIGGSLSGRFQPAGAVRGGLIVFVAATIAILLALSIGQIVPFLIASLIGGIAQGAVNTGGMRAVLAKARPEERSGLIATVYLISYTGAAAPGLVAGQLSTVLPLVTIALGYGGVVLVAAVVAALFIRNPRRA
ncbi:MFS transporter [Microbacteriaceae bacterium VKM Ac-2854]|nr:MFS transporter [Microbacteriaceae bacterium VKM Ac-2854]